MNDKILFTKDETNITITIPIEVLKWAAENHPTDPIEVNDADAFAAQVMFDLEHNLGEIETGYSELEVLLDKVMQHVAEQGFDFAIPKD